MAILYKPMDSSHVEGVFELSKNSFHIPWSLESIQQELTNNLARYIVAMDSDSNKVIGFAGMWIIAGEGNITNIAVDADFKRVEDIPEVEINYIEQKGDVLWAVSFKHIFRFDGEKWAQIKHPFNDQ